MVKAINWSSPRWCIETVKSSQGLNRRNLSATQPQTSSINQDDTCHRKNNRIVFDRFLQVQLGKVISRSSRCSIEHRFRWNNQSAQIVTIVSVNFLRPRDPTRNSKEETQLIKQVEEWSMKQEREPARTLDPRFEPLQNHAGYTFY